MKALKKINFVKKGNEILFSKNSSLRPGWKKIARIIGKKMFTVKVEFETFSFFGLQSTRDEKMSNLLHKILEIFQLAKLTLRVLTHVEHLEFWDGLILPWWVMSAILFCRWYEHTERQSEWAFARFLKEFRSKSQLAQTIDFFGAKAKETTVNIVLQAFAKSVRSKFVKFSNKISLLSGYLIYI